LAFPPVVRLRAAFRGASHDRRFVRYSTGPEDRQGHTAAFEAVVTRADSAHTRRAFTQFRLPGDPFVGNRVTVGKPRHTRGGRDESSRQGHVRAVGHLRVPSPGSLVTPRTKRKGVERVRAPSRIIGPPVDYS
jgi:hypothetical protein